MIRNSVFTLNNENTSFLSNYMCIYPTLITASKPHNHLDIGVITVHTVCLGH